MKNHLSFTQRRPFTAIFLTTLALVLLLAASGTALYFVNGGPAKGWSAQYQPVAIAFPLVAIWLSILIFRSDLSIQARPGSLRGLSGKGKWLFLVPVVALIIQAMEVVPDFNVGVIRITSSVGLGLLVGYVEEGIYRGLFMDWLTPRGIQTAIWGSTSVFALTHAVNALGAQTVFLTVLQICFAAFFGFVAAHLRIATSTLLPLIIWHALFDFFGFLGTRENVYFLAANCVCLAAYGGYLAVRNRNIIKLSLITVEV